MDNKISRLQGAVEYLTSLVTTNTGKVDGLAVRMQATASVQASTASTLVEVRERVSEALAVAGSGAPVGPNGSNSGNTPEYLGDREEADAEKRALVISIRVRCGWRDSSGGGLEGEDGGRGWTLTSWVTV